MAPWLRRNRGPRWFPKQFNGLGLRRGEAVQLYRCRSTPRPAGLARSRRNRRRRLSLLRRRQLRRWSALEHGRFSGFSTTLARQKVGTDWWSVLSLVAANCNIHSRSVLFRILSLCRHCESSTVLPGCEARMRCGLFGKIQSKRDFIAVGTPRMFLAVWEPWIQSAISASRRQLGREWQPAFLTAPVWRFWLGADVCGRTVLGATMASMDGLGRYFPLTLIAV